jgi:hypothetical protein
MVRRVGFGDSLEPKQKSKPSTKNVEPPTRFKPAEADQKPEPEDTALPLMMPISATRLFFKVAKIVIVIAFALNVFDGLVTFALLAWAAFESNKVFKIVKASRASR